MGNVLAAEVPNVATPVLVPPPPTSPPGGPPPPPIPGQEGDSVSEDTGPGTFEDLHRKCKGNTILRSTSVCRLEFPREAWLLFDRIAGVLIASVAVLSVSLTSQSVTLVRAVT